jgi:GNAT superfamily N-acetyltransferase
MQADSIRIRPAENRDCEAIFRLVNGLAHAVGDSGKIVGTVADLETYGFGESPLFHALLAEVDGEAVGLCLYFYTYSTWLGTPGIYVQDLFISQAARGTGLGRRLLENVAAVGRAANANHLRLAVYQENEAAQQFYRAIGMRYREEECIYQADGEVFLGLAGAGDQS